MRKRFTLAYHDPDDNRPGSWVLRRADGGNPDDRGEVLATTNFHFRDGRYPAQPGAAQAWATRSLYAHEVRTVRWEPVPDSPTEAYEAVTGLPRGGWAVTEYLGHSGIRYRLSSAGSWLAVAGPDAHELDGLGRRFRDLDELAEQDSPLTPRAVLNLPALLAELDIFRAVAGYVTGPDGCVADYACDEYVTADHAGETLEHCSHVRHRIASSRDVAALARVDSALAALDAESTVPDDQADRYSVGELTERGGQRRAVEYIREARNREDDGS